MVTQPWDAPDFLDKERSPNLQEEGYSKALEAKESTNVQEAKRKESEAGLESEEPKKKAPNDELWDRKQQNILLKAGPKLFWQK